MLHSVLNDGFPEESAILPRMMDGICADLHGRGQQLLQAHVLDLQSLQPFRIGDVHEAGTGP